MRRADRLFALVHQLRARRVSTAAVLAERLGVSERTIYRDVADLAARGVPIDGEAGVGYRLRAGYLLPPLMFTTAEAQALVASVRLAQPWLDPALAAEAESALAKVLAVLGPQARTEAEGVALFAARLQAGESAVQQSLQRARSATAARQWLCFDYVDAGGRLSQRRVRPLGCFHWGEAWTLAAWCEARADFRNFRLDRMRAIAPTAERFRDEPGRTLADFLRAMQAQPPARPGARVAASEG